MGSLSRSVVLAAAAFMLVPAAAAAQDNASTALNILPSGQFEDASAPGATRQAEMYNALTPLRDNITGAQLPNYFKSEALDPGNTIVRTETIPGHPGVEIRRDAYDVPHIYGQTDDDVTFGAGYAIAEDRNLLINQARFDSLTAAVDAPGPSAIDLVANLYQFAASHQTERIVSRQTQVLRKGGPKGVQLLHDIDTYVAGLNAWYAANQPSAPPFTRNDITASTRSRASTSAAAAAARPTTPSSSTACSAGLAPPRASTCSRTSRAATTLRPRRR